MTCSTSIYIEYLISIFREYSGKSSTIFIYSIFIITVYLHCFNLCLQNSRTTILIF